MASGRVELLAVAYGDIVRSRSPSWSSIITFVTGTARQLKQMPDTRSSSVSTRESMGRSYSTSP